MDNKDQKRIAWRLAFKPHDAQEVALFVDWYAYDVPVLMDEIRELRHQMNCLLTQTNEHVEADNG